LLSLSRNLTMFQGNPTFQHHEITNFWRSEDLRSVPEASRCRGNLLTACTVRKRYSLRHCTVKPSFPSGLFHAWTCRPRMHRQYASTTLHGVRFHTHQHENLRRHVQHHNWPWEDHQTAARAPRPHLKIKHTHLLTPYSTVLLEKLTDSELVKKFPIFYRTQRFITAFTNARHLSLSGAWSIQSTPTTSHFLKTHLNIVFPFKSGSSKCPIYIRFPHQNSVCTSLLPHTCYMPRPSHSSRFYHPHNIWWAVQIIKLLIM